MEEAGYLDVSNEVNMLCFHYVFIPRINQHLEHFINGWNDHPIRIARNKMPNHLCSSGLCNIAISTDTAGNFMQSHNCLNVKKNVFKKITVTTLMCIFYGFTCIYYNSHGCSME